MGGMGGMGWDGVGWGRGKGEGAGIVRGLEGWGVRVGGWTREVKR